ncbi:MAG: hypothetical protein P4L22_03050 [Candidatus Babeliales bacterium]|nr:hypothetical protein [Candidatus Babeliales bacterium]
MKYILFPIFLINILALNAFDQQLNDLSEQCYKFGHNNISSYTHFCELYNSKIAYVFLQSGMEFLTSSALGYLQVYDTSEIKNELIIIQVKEIYSTIKVYFKLLKEKNKLKIAHRVKRIKEALENLMDSPLPLIEL